MCGIAGYRGPGAEKLVEKMLAAQKHRGPDASGIYHDGRVRITTPAGEEVLEAPVTGDVALGHNLLSIIGGPQPVTGRGVLVFNGEIYNHRELHGEGSDAEVLLKLIEEQEGDMEEVLRSTVNTIDGDYAFAYYDGENLALVRDPVGVKPLHHSGEAFASEKKALWRIGLGDVGTLKPGHALINGREVRLRGLPEPEPLRAGYDELRDELIARLRSAVEKRTRGLDRAAMVFSGGVDSTMLAVLLKEHLDIRLYAVGTRGAGDLEFASRAADDLKLDLEIIEVDEETIREALPGVLTAIEEYSVMKIGVAMPLYIASGRASSEGYRVMFSGQGADELFAGYHRYRRLLEEGKLEEALIHDLENIYHVNLERDDAAAMANSMELRVPFLDLEVIGLAVSIPISYRILGPGDELRKRILREAALELGVPEYIAMRPKKAAQYGSGIDRILRRKVLPEFDHESFMEKLMGTRESNR
ncbi:asparagine synthetase B [Methanothermobacter wolfeii]|uniref:Putative asparagine synthetase [glutamine-hydrolyzing] n=1 Tax=Methanothermobacter wolfeii TaxID=145261 RepID=A0A9E7RYA1_METWO|nr:asparagine synthetase B [Methanothermobacter wolfeii]MDI6701620.1 asparagine synthetase B [Methanothermobacter wolfeii]MDI6841719.1 asparagine synthetase B [Methanothermobacter wolfeii]UXH32609.1 asparagine synthetase B [Methanothermobacter wolfeii]